eukprot:scaffold27859_cov109-Isochrysis_galbana.AAC.5
MFSSYAHVSPRTSSTPIGSGGPKPESSSTCGGGSSRRSHGRSTAGGSLVECIRFESTRLFQAYRSYCAESLRTLERRFRFYGDIIYRQRRWKMHLMRQKSESNEAEAVRCSRLWSGCGPRTTNGRCSSPTARGAWGL